MANVLISLVILLLFVRQCFLFGSKVIQDKLELVSYHKDYFSNMKVDLFDLNGNPNTKAVNMSYTLKQDLPEIVMIQIQVYTLLNHDYRVFPLNATVDICPLLAQDTPQVQKLHEHSNFRKCPFKKGNYQMSNFVSETHKPPPYMPTGSYMAESKLYINKNVQLYTSRFYARIV